MIVHPPHPWFAAHAFVDVVQSHLKGRADRLVVLDGDAEVMPGINVMLLGGHTMGSQAVLVQTDGGPLVLTGDVALTPRNLRDDVPPGYNCDLQACFQGLAHIRRLNAPVITGHDPEYSE